jgi:hypothetical protein
LAPRKGEKLRYITISIFDRQFQAWRFVGAIFFVLALYFSQTSPIKDEVHAAEEGKEKAASTAASTASLVFDSPS